LFEPRAYQSVLTKTACSQHTTKHQFNDIVNALYNVIIECSIRDPDGVAMWKKYFLKKETVPWTEFIQIFIQMIQQKKDEGDINQLLPVIPTLAQLRSASDAQLSVSVIQHEKVQPKDTYNSLSGVC